MIRKRNLIAIAASVIMMLPGTGLAADAQSPAVAEPADAEITEKPQETEDLLVAAVHGTIRMKGMDGNAHTIPSGDGVTLLPSEGYSVTVVPDDGYAVCRVLLNGTETETTPNDSGAVSFSVPAGFEELAVLCSPQVETRFEIEGEGKVTVLEDGVAVPVADGATYASDGHGTLTVEVEDQADSAFAGAVVDGDAIPAEQTNGRWVMSVEERPNSVVHVDFTPALTVLSEQDNCTIEALQDGEWTPVSPGTATLRTDYQDMAFRVQPEEGFELDEVLVNGTAADVCTGNGGAYEFCVEQVDEDVYIAAVCMSPNDSIAEVDESTGVRYTLPGRDENPESNITAGSRLDIQELTEGERLERANTACASYGSVVSAYDIVLQDEGETYEPAAPVTVSFPVPEELSEASDDEIAVIHISEGGSLNRIPFERRQVDGRDYLVGTADHFSTFAVVRAPKDEVALLEGGARCLGDATNLTLYIVLAAIAAGCVVLALFMMRRAKKRSR